MLDILRIPQTFTAIVLPRAGTYTMAAGRR
jgi:hypothetical protein